jgi:hypothetical protein
MLPISDFVGALTVAGKPFKEIEETVKKVYRDKTLKKTQLYEIIRKGKEGKPVADQRIFNSKCRIRDPTFITDVAAQVANDRRVTVRKLVEAHGVSTRTIQATLHEDLHLSKKSARWVPKLLNQEMKNETPPLLHGNV